MEEDSFNLTILQVLIDVGLNPCSFIYLLLNVIMLGYFSFYLSRLQLFFTPFSSPLTLIFHELPYLDTSYCMHVGCSLYRGVGEVPPNQN